MSDYDTDPKPGQFLYASCAGENIYEVLKSYKDDNGAPVLDVRVLDLNEVVSFGDGNGVEDIAKGKWDANPLTRIELPPGTTVIFRGLLWRAANAEYPKLIEVAGPPGLCYRCSILMSIEDK